MKRIDKLHMDHPHMESRSLRDQLNRQKALLSPGGRPHESRGAVGVCGSRSVVNSGSSVSFGQTALSAPAFRHKYPEAYESSVDIGYGACWLQT